VSGSLRILFVLRHNGYVRNWEWVIRELLARGHRVHLGFELGRERTDIVERLVAEYPGLTHGPIPVREDAYALFARRLGGTVDYLRYFTPEYRDAEKLRRRARRGAPAPVRALMASRTLRRPGVVEWLDRTCRRLEDGLPSFPELERVILHGDYDVVMATPLVSSTAEHEVLRVAARLGRFTVLPVTSWDNLTNKGLVRVRPDRVYVWNEAQRTEAVVMHGLAADSVVVVGAHTYDHWFRWAVARSRRELCAEAGLDPSRPYLLYTCSSGFVMADERPLVRRWVEALRSSPHEALRGASVLVRPHPRTGKVWAESGLGDLENVAVWPPTGADPRTDAARSVYFDSLSHCAAVVGLNTSALVEAAIAGKASYTFVLPETRATQDGTLHFHHLLRENGGPLLVARSMDEHLAQLAEALERPDEGREAVEAFVASFVRPLGRERECAPILVDDLEAAVATRSPAAPVPVRLPGTAARALAQVGGRPTHHRPPVRKRVARARQACMLALARITPEPVKDSLRRRRASRAL
jgi:hypothetical protein